MQEIRLPYFSIDGCFGGSQSWMLDPQMRLGGCAALTACDLCIYLSLQKGYTSLFPFAGEALTKQVYRKFSEIMKPYLHPRMTGVDTLKLFLDGFRQYLADIPHSSLHLSPFYGDRPVEQAEQSILNRLRDGFPLPCLVLNHKNKAFSDFVWHWFLIVGCRKEKGRFQVLAATYGEGVWLDFARLWDTGFIRKGGLVLVENCRESSQPVKSRLF